MKKSFGSMLAAFALSGVLHAAGPNDPCLFTQDVVPADEARILALAGVNPEWKCHYQLSPNSRKGDNLIVLFAELYSGTDCLSRYLLANVVSDPAQPLQGVISAGWNDQTHQLTVVATNGQFQNNPWTTGPIKLPLFSPAGGHFFSHSVAETRHAPAPFNDDYVVFPVLGIRGNSLLKWNATGITSTQDFLTRCVQSHSKYALVIYLYKGGASPPLHLQQNQ